MADLDRYERVTAPLDLYNKLATALLTDVRYAAHPLATMSH